MCRDGLNGVVVSLVSRWEVGSGYAFLSLLVGHESVRSTNMWRLSDEALMLSGSMLLDEIEKLSPATAVNRSDLDAGKDRHYVIVALVA